MDALSLARQSKLTSPISRYVLAGRMRRSRRKHLYHYFSRGRRCEISSVLCCITSLIAIRTKTSPSTCLRITRQWYDYCLSVIIKAPDRDPKSYSTIGSVLKRKSSSSASTKTTLTRSRGCQKMRSDYDYAAEAAPRSNQHHRTRALFASRGASVPLITAEGEDGSL